MKNKGFGQLKTRLFTMKISKNVGLRGPAYYMLHHGFLFPLFLEPFEVPNFWSKFRFPPILWNRFSKVQGANQTEFSRFFFGFSPENMPFFGQCVWEFVCTRWAPTSYKWIYNPYEWPYKWVTGVITSISGVITLLLITGRGPLW